MNFLLDQIFTYKAQILSFGVLITSGLFVYRIKFKSNIIENHLDLVHVKLDGEICILTGANSGIGYETSLDLAKRGATVILACRDLVSGQKCANRIKTLSGNQNVFLKHLDLSSLDSVRKFAKDIAADLDHIDTLINNAG
jgi:hypothetical protein